MNIVVVTRHILRHDAKMNDAYPSYRLAGLEGRKKKIQQKIYLNKRVNQRAE